MGSESLIFVEINDSDPIDPNPIDPLNAYEEYHVETVCCRGCVG